MRAFKLLVTVDCFPTICGDCRFATKMRRQPPHLGWCVLFAREIDRRQRCEECVKAETSAKAPIAGGGTGE